MKMNVVELSKRKGGPSALRLVALLSLILGACTSRQTGPTQQADAGPPCNGNYLQDASLDIGTKLGVTQLVCAKPGGKVTVKAKIEACLNFAGGSPFGQGAYTIRVQQDSSTSLDIPPTATSGSYSFRALGVIGGKCEPRDGDGLTGTLQVGTGGGTGEEKP